MIIVTQTMHKISQLGKIGLPSFASVSRVIPLTLVISCPRRPVKRVELTGFQDLTNIVKRTSCLNVMGRCLIHASHLIRNLAWSPFDFQVSWLKKSCCQSSEIAPAKPFTAHDVKERRSWRRREAAAQVKVGRLLLPNWRLLSPIFVGDWWTFPPHLTSPWWYG